jgi:hypothetical protein
MVLKCSRFSCNKCPFRPATVPKPNLALLETNRIAENDKHTGTWIGHTEIEAAGLQEAG